MRVNVTPAGGEPSITNFLIEVDDDGDANVFDTVRYVNASGVIGDVEVWQTDAVWAAKTVTSLSVNTVYRYRVKSRNADSEESSYGATVSTYTLSQTPDAPVVDTRQDTSMRVNVTPAGGEPAITSFLIEVDDDGDANVFDTVRYVNASGVIGDVEVWQTDATWGAKTVTGLTQNTLYRFQVKARNGDSVETTAGTRTDGQTLSGTPGSSVVDNLNTTSMRVNVTPGRRRTLHHKLFD